MHAQFEKSHRHHFTAARKIALFVSVAMVMMMHDSIFSLLPYCLCNAGKCKCLGFSFSVSLHMNSGSSVDRNHTRSLAGRRMASGRNTWWCPRHHRHLMKTILVIKPHQDKIQFLLTFLFVICIIYRIFTIMSYIRLMTNKNLEINLSNFRCLARGMLIISHILSKPSIYQQFFF